MAVIFYTSDETVTLPHYDDGSLTISTQAAEVVTKVSMAGDIQSYGIRSDTVYSASFSNVSPNLLRTARDFLVKNCTELMTIIGIQEKPIIGYVTNNPVEISWDALGEFGSIDLTIVGKESDVNP